ncbi:hypothetical protein R1flu_022823 [Riccia fluitans]|uniref:Uncharacterized protein n=1 Tax=Riccia fluitans TaxID=41844 RepID=A0ABD1XT82_9MARC
MHESRRTVGCVVVLPRQPRRLTNGRESESEDFRLAVGLSGGMSLGWISTGSSGTGSPVSRLDGRNWRIPTP